MHSWPAPAKLNLFLHIIGRRADGYHLLQTLFQFTELVDRLQFTVTQTPAIIRTPALEGIHADTDLVIRAAKALQKASGCRQGAAIHLEKRIPIGGGLGGGSSDAATTLVALNHLWGLNLPRQEIASIGLGLGADIPIFVWGHAAWAEGIGERFDVVDIPERWYLIVYPGCTVKTADVFNADNLTRDTVAIKIGDFLSGRTWNDCEAVVRRRYPVVGEALDWLSRYSKARLTGTGSCVFSAFDDRQDALEICRRLPSDWQGFVAKGRNRSPLFDRGTVCSALK